MGVLGIKLPPKEPPTNLEFKFQVPKLEKPKPAGVSDLPCIYGWQGWQLAHHYMPLEFNDPTWEATLEAIAYTHWFPPQPDTDPLEPVTFVHSWPFSEDPKVLPPKAFAYLWTLDITPVGDWENHWIRLVWTVDSTEEFWNTWYSFARRYRSVYEGIPVDFLGMVVLGTPGEIPEEDVTTITVQTQINYENDLNGEWDEDDPQYPLQNLAHGTWTNIGPPLILVDSPRIVIVP